MEDHQQEEDTPDLEILYPTHLLPQALKMRMMMKLAHQTYT
jgi:hypothetical protein